MDDTLKGILGLREHEGEDGKLRPEVVVYLAPDQIGTKQGAHCGACFFFHSKKANASSPLLRPAMLSTASVDSS